MTVEERIRKRRREAGFARALVPLEGDLDELQALLADAISDFEGVLEHLLDALPEWANVGEEMQRLYETTIAGQTVTIGPRAAAIAAAKVDEFIRVWLSKHDVEARPDVIDDEAGTRWRAGVDEVAAVVASVAAEGRASANTAQEALPSRLEELLAELEEARTEQKPAGLEDLKRRLRKGQVGAALLDRETKADSFEEQRRKAEELREAWDGLEELAFAAAEISVDASERLDALLRSAVEAIVEGYPELVAYADGWVEPKVVRKRAFNIPSVPTEDRRGSPSSRPDVDDAHRVTEPIGITRTEEYSRDDSDADRDAEGPVLDVVPARRADSQPPPTPVHARQRLDTDAARSPRETPAPPSAPVAATMELVLDEAEFTDPAHRVRVGWTVVTPSEAALVVGPPALFVGFMAGATLAFRVGLWGHNPFLRWPWALTVFVWVAVYSVGMPIFLRWRVEWNGYVPRPLRLTEHRQEAFAVVDTESLRLAGQQFQFASAMAELGRWKSGTSRGWTLLLQAPDGSTTRLVSDAASQRWLDATIQYRDEMPHGCWQVSEGTLLQVADRFVR